MPIYSYECKTCKKPWEELKNVSERDDIGICPFCSSQDCQRVIDKGSFIINGYSEANGYARKN